MTTFLSEPQLKRLERYCRATSRRPGLTLYRQDEPAHVLYLLMEGTIELRARPPGRRVYRTVELVRPTCTFGDEALFGLDGYLCGARVLDTARMLTLTRTGFESLADRRPELAAALLRASGSCLLQTFRRAAILTQAPADVGLRALLGELAAGNGRANGRPGTLHVTHAQLAGVLHLSRETVSRMLANLAGEGVVELGRGVIRVRQR